MLRVFLLKTVICCVIFYLRQRERYMQLPLMFVCLSVSVSKITQKCAHGLGWNFACLQVSGHGRTDQLLSPSLDAGTVKSETESRSNRHLTQSRLQVTGCSAEKYCLLRCSPRATEFPRSAQLLCTMYGCGAVGHQTWPIFRFWPIFQYTTYMYWCGLTLQWCMVLEWFYSVETTLSEVHALHRVPF